ncbi:hypothetical protein KCP69_22980 [Salmonella enterica subsp. enterica]|nr:hypothetical protein KCP69_22980 [Salmonella enterica subsp. enterica]
MQIRELGLTLLPYFRFVGASFSHEASSSGAGESVYWCQISRHDVPDAAHLRGKARYLFSMPRFAFVEHDAG